jgi:hypothetical protein
MAEPGELIGPIGDAALTNLLNMIQGGSPIGQSGLSGVIAPTLDLGLIMPEYAIDAGDNVDPTSTGWYYLRTVPVGQLWVLHAFSVSQASGTCTFDQIGINDGTSTWVVLTQSAGTTIDWQPNTPIPIASGWRFRAQVAAYSSGLLNYRLMVAKYRLAVPGKLS